MKKVLFSEKQYFPKWMAGLIFGFTLAVLIFSLFMIQQDEPESLTWIIPIYIVCLVPVALPFFISVEVKISEEGVYWRSRPMQKKFRFVKKEEAEIRFSEAGIARKVFNYGMKYSGLSTYLLVGKHNLLIKHGKKTVVIGTKKPHELRRALDALKNKDSQYTDLKYQ